ncbi:integrin beta-1-binding protein 1 isoform X3 [Heterocephalus glaber]|uniref:Integrin beta-1-binding protein 1 n=1 Tax=Heterocephalus glaber TaxID=10181 RepID=A0AAX6SJW5_HETGA|nr:integrin beta-1-binding protein 1 isoform X3 [Heterocephalus glaber]
MFRKGKKRHSSSSSQSSEISTKSKSVDSSLGGLSRSSTVASLDTDSTKSSGQSNNNSDTCAEFRIKYVGAIEKLKLSEGKSLEGPLDLINYIDVAQQDGKLPFVPLEEEYIMGVSKYGIKVSTLDQYYHKNKTKQAVILEGDKDEHPVTSPLPVLVSSGSHGAPSLSTPRQLLG